MRLALENDIPELRTVYNDAMIYAESVGHIDWPSPFPVSALRELITNKELYCFEVSGQVIAAQRINYERDERIWENDGQEHIYIGKVATASAVRTQNYFGSVMLPAAIKQSVKDTDSVRLDCLADNVRLKNFYSRVGFTSLGNATFYSEKQQRPITVTRFERLIDP